MGFFGAIGGYVKEYANEKKKHTIKCMNAMVIMILKRC